MLKKQSKSQAAKEWIKKTPLQLLEHQYKKETKVAGNLLIAIALLSVLLTGFMLGAWAMGYTLSNRKQTVQTAPVRIVDPVKTPSPTMKPTSKPTRTPQVI